MLRSLDISTSALVAQRQRMNTVAANIANAQTTRNERGEASPYQRRLVRFTEHTAAAPKAGQRPAGGSGVDYTVEIDQTTPPRKLHQPGHPDADAEGYVSYPAIDLVTEFVNALEASRAYQANVATMEMSKAMEQTTLRILG